MDVLALLVFLGGFSAATAMLLVEAIALATMVSNICSRGGLFMLPP
jgi:hypothetical protein